LGWRRRKDFALGRWRTNKNDVGILGRGERPCAEDSTSIDGVCGVVYFRHPTTLQRISEEESYKRAINRQLAVTCVQVQDKSICWLFR